MDPHARSAPSGDRLDVTQNADLCAALAEALGLDKVRVLSAAAGHARRAEREQWDDGNNFLALAPGVVVGYERNTDHQHATSRKHGIEIVTDRRRRARPRPRRSALHELPHRARPAN